MKEEITTAMIAAWLAGLLILPAIVLVAGVFSARRSARSEAAARHPRPPADHVPTAAFSLGLRDPARAHAQGVLSARAFKVQSPDEILRILSRHYGLPAEIQGVEGEEERFRVVAPANPATLGAPVVGEPACHYDTGVLQGLFENFLGTRVCVQEVECRAAGENRCTFDVCPAADEESSAPASVPGVERSSRAPGIPASANGSPSGSTGGKA